MDNKVRLCIVVTMSSSIDNWIKPFINDYIKNGFDLTLVCNATKSYVDSFINEYPNVRFISYNFPRGFSILKSILSIRFLSKLFKKTKFDMVQYSTPNASFYASVAAKKRRIKHRLYCQWGMVFTTAKGIKKIILKSIEKLTCKNSSLIEPDSFGNLEYCIKNKFYTEQKSRVIWNGSAKGIDLVKFDVKRKEQYKDEILDTYPFIKDKFIIGFVGRLGKDKGSNELISAFLEIEKIIPEAVLLFVGPLEKKETIDPKLLHYFFSNEKIIKTDRVSSVEKYYSVFDIFVLPSYREGFGMSVVEAESFGVPVIVTKYPGPECGMLDKITGFAIDRFSVNQIVESVLMLYNDKELYKKMSQNAILFARENYDFEIFRKKYIEDRLNIVREEHRDFKKGG